MKITTILPVSRTTYLDRVLDCIKNQTYQPDKLIVIYDGHDSQFLEVRNKVAELEIPAERIIVPSDNRAIAQTIYDRRKNIVNNHNKFRELIMECDWIWSLEDDGIVPNDALERLLNHVGDKVGMITGVELGRWGTQYVGAWRTNDVVTPSEVYSLENKAQEGGVDEIDGCGLYCSLIRYEGYKNHHFFTNNGLGPDVNLGFYLRSLGYENYIDWSIHVTHLTHRNNQEIEIPATSDARVVKFTLYGQSTWRY